MILINQLTVICTGGVRRTREFAAFNRIIVLLGLNIITVLPMLKKLRTSRTSSVFRQSICSLHYEQFLMVWKQFLMVWKITFTTLGDLPWMLLFLLRTCVTAYWELRQWLLNLKWDPAFLFFFFHKMNTFHLLHPNTCPGAVVNAQDSKDRILFISKTTCSKNNVFFWI